MPETVASGYCTFQKVAFDLKKLAEYDPQGTREFMESHGIQIADAPKQKPKNKSQRERYRFSDLNTSRFGYSSSDLMTTHAWKRACGWVRK